MCELPTDETIVLDYRNSKLKLLDKKFQVLSHFYVSTYTYDLCLIPPSEAVVTMNKKNRIKMRYNRRNKMRKIMTNRFMSYR